MFTSTRLAKECSVQSVGAFRFGFILRIQMVPAIGAGWDFSYTCIRRSVHLFQMVDPDRGGRRDRLAVWANRLYSPVRYGPVSANGYGYATFPLLYAIYVFVLAAFRKAEGSLYLAVAASP